LENLSANKINRLKFILPLALLLLCLIIDQWIKVYVKTHYWPHQQIPLLGKWFELYFIENNGMAFGIELGGSLGKFLLTGFRLAVSGFGAWYLWQSMKKQAPMGLLISIALIMAGAIGNIIDSVFYGVLFAGKNDYTGGWFQGQVVDMFHAPIYHGFFPNWFPIWGGQEFTFFSPIWNFADACITVGVAIIIVGQHRFFPHQKEGKGEDSESQTQPESDSSEEIVKSESEPPQPQG
jgi:signal peptidase II